jgi:hypothetical protein
MLCAIAKQFEDWSASYRIFEKGRIDRRALFAPARKAVEERLKRDAPLVVMMDDTLLRKRGRKVYGTGWKRDPLGPHFQTNFVWGQRYLQVSAALPDPSGSGRARGIPIDFIHAPSVKRPKKTAAAEQWSEYRRQQELAKVSAVAAERIKALRREVTGRNIICAVDGGFTNQTVFRNIPEGVTLIGRIRKDAKLFTPPEEKQGARKGRRRFYGDKLPTPEEVRRDASLGWKTVEAFAAGKRHRFEVKTMPAVRWVGAGDRTAQVVIIRPLAYRPRKGGRLLYRNPAYLICTDPTLSLEDLLQAYLWRWEIEVNFKEEKTTLGVGEAQVRVKSSVETAPALIVAAYAFLLLAGTQLGDESALPRPKWYPEQPEDRWSTPRLINLFRAQLWKIAIHANLKHFDSVNTAARTHFFKDILLASSNCDFPYRSRRETIWENQGGIGRLLLPIFTISSRERYSSGPGRERARPAPKR